MASDARPSLMLAAGAAMILLGAGALLLPAIRFAQGAAIGWLLLLGGLVELLAGRARHARARDAAMIAGAITTLAGFLFLINPLLGVYPASYVVIGWLLARAAVLLNAAMKANGGTRFWAAFSGIADLLLGLILLLGLPLAAVVLSLFGPTEEMVASFAYVFAASFLVTGVALLALALTERRAIRGEIP
jgi:uncharacterized membrane protein HdeD (DUF308 family)